MGATDDLAQRILMALVEGYAARDGMKDRLRALNEWEIARRSGYTELSYAEYLEHPQREDVGNALLRLQRQGLVSVWDRGAKYDSFIPTSTGTEAAAPRNATPPVHGSGAAEPGADSAVDTSNLGHDDRDPTLTRLDEIIRLLRSIDARLTR